MSAVTATLAPSRDLQAERLLVSRISSSIQLAEDDLDKKQVPRKVSWLTFVSLPICILQFYIFYCPCWNRLAFYFVCMKQCPREADTTSSIPPGKVGNWKPFGPFGECFSPTAWHFRGWENPFHSSTRFLAIWGLTLQLQHVITRPFFWHKGHGKNFWFGKIHSVITFFLQLWSKKQERP